MVFRSWKKVLIYQRVTRGRKSKDRQYNGQTGQKTKQLSTKHYTEN
jgi:hypothetical protein